MDEGRARILKGGNAVKKRRERRRPRRKAGSSGDGTVRERAVGRHIGRMSPGRHPDCLVALEVVEE
jgi:hypothetical protein